MCAGTAGCLCPPHQHRDASLPCVTPAPQVFSLQQGKRDIDAIYSMGLFEDVAMRPQPAEGSSLENPKVRRPSSHIHVCPASCWTSFVVGNRCWQSLLAIVVGNRCWQSLLTIVVGNRCWQSLLAIVVGNRCWQPQPDAHCWLPQLCCEPYLSSPLWVDPILESIKREQLQSCMPSVSRALAAPYPQV